jgi:hypothetical protein
VDLLYCAQKDLDKVVTALEYYPVHSCCTAKVQNGQYFSRLNQANFTLQDRNLKLRRVACTHSLRLRSVKSEA